MDRIKAILFKEYYVREVLTLFFIVASLLFLSIYTSFALFEKSVEKVGIAAISASTLDVALSKTTITVPAGETVFEDITVTNNSGIAVKYKLFTTNTASDVTVGIASTSENADTGVISANGEIIVRIGIKNDSTSDVVITLGVQSGYAHNEVELAGGNALGTVEENNNYVDPSGANEPVLAEGMIPVIYDETCESTTAADNASGCWEVADTSQAWYSYADQMWANAVTTSVASYRTASVGTEIPMDYINSMWVWIPRYRYNIPSDIGSSSEVTEPPQIDVVFETGTETNGVTETVYRNGIADDGTNTNYYTHPAFRNVDNIEYDSSTTSKGAWDEEITGFWVGKFETGTSDETCNNHLNSSSTTCLDVEPIIKPDIQSLRYQTVSTQFTTALKFAGGTYNTSTGDVTFTTNENNIYGLNTTTNTTDTHMMKNTEWGAVAILSQSQYGKMGNTNYTGTNKEVYKNDSFSSNRGSYTGRSKGLLEDPMNIGSYSTYGTYSYNNFICDGSICAQEKVEFSGVGASTTGTVYGIYDMSGGSHEYTMGNWKGLLGDSNFYVNITEKILPPSKYYDLYKGTSSSNITKEKSILGDATWETKTWYRDYGEFMNNDYPWAVRGYNYDSSSYHGVFSSSKYPGNSMEDYSFRTVLIP